jgi:hypothetical protein
MMPTCSIFLTAIGSHPLSRIILSHIVTLDVRGEKDIIDGAHKKRSPLVLGWKGGELVLIFVGDEMPKFSGIVQHTMPSPSASLCYNGWERTFVKVRCLQDERQRA